MTNPFKKDQKSFILGLIIGIIAFSVMSLIFGVMCGASKERLWFAPLCGGIAGSVTILPVSILIFIILAIVQSNVTPSNPNAQSLSDMETEGNPPQAKPKQNYWMMMFGTICSYLGITFAYGLFTLLILQVFH
jgi:uncharacterized membrane protein